jgi:hypothetical protein
MSTTRRGTSGLKPAPGMDGADGGLGMLFMSGPFEAEGMSG